MKVYGKERKSTLCWKCKKATCKCSWSKNFIPVKGWKAEPTKVLSRNSARSDRTVDSYLVLECPEFVEG